MNDDNTEGTAFKKDDLVVCVGTQWEAVLTKGQCYRVTGRDGTLVKIQPVGLDVEPFPEGYAFFAWRFKALEGFPDGTRVRVVKDPFYTIGEAISPASLLKLGEVSEVTQEMDRDGDVRTPRGHVNVTCLEVVEPEPTIAEAELAEWEQELIDATELAEDEADLVNHPQHYLKHPSGVEIIDITRHHSFTIGNALKYIFRHEHKGNPVQDLQKAIKYLEFAIEDAEKAESEVAA